MFERGRMGGWNLAALAAVVLLAAGVLAVPTSVPHLHAASSAGVDASSFLNVTAIAPYTFVPDIFEIVPTDTTIHVMFTDSDTIPHTFSILDREGYVIPTSYTPTQLDQLFVTYGNLTNLAVTGAGDQVTGTFLSPGPGWYEFVCLESGHFQIGMYGFIAFGENLPSKLTNVAAASPEFVNLSATSSLSFVPDSFTVLPGAAVHLIVTQLADFDHTVTLSPAVNVTIPSSDSPAQLTAFFQAHPPIVNLSLGPTVGQRYFANFTAPMTLGTYEYVCLIHFPTMTGIMTVASAVPSPATSSSPTTLEIVGIGTAIGVVVIVVGLAAWSRARHRDRSGGGCPPAP
jgi:plastocyanin